MENVEVDYDLIDYQLPEANDNIVADTNEN